MGRLPLVSVIVPVYRTEAFLAECLESLMAQSFSDWECIIIDDGSENPELIDVLAAELLGAKGFVIHQENRGLPAARNRGLKAASGDYLLCLDSDDLLHPEYLVKMVAALLADSRAGVAFCWTRCFGQDDSVIRPVTVEQFWLLQRNLITVTSLFRRSMWQHIGDFDETMKSGLEDWEFWIRASLEGYLFNGVRETLFFYRRSAESMVVSAARNRVDTIHYIRNKYAAIYFQPLHRILQYKRFSHISRLSIVRFWMSGIFFHYFPRRVRRLVFRIYQWAID